MFHYSETSEVAEGMSSFAVNENFIEVVVPCMFTLDLLVIAFSLAIDILVVNMVVGGGFFNFPFC